MKSWKYIILLVILALPVAMIGAQEEEITEGEGFIGSYSVVAESGTFTAEDEGYRLVLNNVPRFVAWVVTTPDVSAGLMSTNDLIGFWSFQPELTATAVISTENENIYLTIGLIDADAYDMTTGTLTFSAEVERIESLDSELEASKVKLPDEFDFATLFITIDSAFVEGIEAGAILRSEGTRMTGTSNTCIPKPNKPCP